MVEETSSGNDDGASREIETEPGLFEVGRAPGSHPPSNIKGKSIRKSVALSGTIGVLLGALIGIVAFAWQPTREKLSPHHEAITLLPAMLPPPPSPSSVITSAQAVFPPPEKAGGSSKASTQADLQSSIQTLEDKLTNLSNELDQLKEMKAQVLRDGAALNELKAMQVEAARDNAALAEQIKQSQEQWASLVARSKAGQPRPPRIDPNHRLNSSPPVEPVAGNPADQQIEPGSPRAILRTRTPPADAASQPPGRRTPGP